MYALGFPVESWRHAKPKRRAASTLVPDILPALVLDDLNYGKSNPKQKPLLVKKDFWSGLSEQHQRLLARAQEGYAYRFDGFETSPGFRRG